MIRELRSLGYLVERLAQSGSPAWAAAVILDPGLFGRPREARSNPHSLRRDSNTDTVGPESRRMGGSVPVHSFFCSSFRRYRFRTLHSVLLCSCTKCLIVSRALISPGGPPERFGTDVDAISASYSYFNALIGSTRDARCAGMNPAHSATTASATAESASTAGSAPVI
jgi:hypothetical protein